MMLNMQRVNKRHDARAVSPSVQNHRQWLMARHAKSAVNVVTVNAFRTVKLKDYRVVCAISFKTHANGNNNKKEKVHKKKTAHATRKTTYFFAIKKKLFSLDFVSQLLSHEHK